MERRRVILREIPLADDNYRMQRSQKSLSARVTWTPAQRGFASVLIAAHLAAVVIAPWSSPPPAPLLAEQAARAISPYLAAGFLNHGYRFFAPDPGPSHLVRYELTRADGSVLEGKVPVTKSGQGLVKTLQDASPVNRSK